MEKKHKCFLVVEGLEDGYPSYEINQVSLLTEDPATHAFKNLFICSPLFSIHSDGTELLPEIFDGTKITFVMCPNVFPTFWEMLRKFSPKNEIWFSLGLANLVIFEPPAKSGKTSEILAFLKQKDTLIASESWTIEKGKIARHTTNINHNHTEVEHCELKISEKLPLSLKFSVSEYIISVDKFLTASKKFTPHYYPGHKKTIAATNKRLVNDLSFIYGDSSFEPSLSLLKSLNKRNNKEALESLDEVALKEKKEEIINDRHGRLVQFNSSLSYLYSQAYSGTFPIFDHIGIIRRHSLLGVGTAISALFEIVSQTEEALVFLPFDDLNKLYPKNEFIKLEYLNILKDPSKYDSGIWHGDKMIEKISIATSAISKSKGDLKKPDDYFNRLAFYSGRLGFREYDFSATSAIQVLVEANSLEWNVINYTHEIIHNHVRAILNSNLINVPLSLRNSKYSDWLNNIINFVFEVHHDRIKADVPYKDFFVSVLINYCVNSKYFGSLSRESDGDLITERRADYALPTAPQLKELIKDIYRDINEIFVHIIDFTYVYKRDITAYILSIWASWSTVASVTNDIKQYIIRTLLVIGITTSGTSKNRFREAKLKFLQTIPQLVNRNNSYIFDNVRDVLSEVPDDDLLYRFYNSIIIADLVYNFFVGDIELLLENDDENVLEKITGVINEPGETPPQIYDLESNEFKKIEIRSKIVFLLDQLVREIRRTESSAVTSDSMKERLSAWLLLSLSSYNKS